jgi:[protein-PII] uridylyltransferase
MTVKPEAGKSPAALQDALAQQAGRDLTEQRGGFWRSQIERLMQEHRAGARGSVIARAITDVVDVIVLDAHRHALDQHESKPFALVALGGYGRQEMSPYSDVDLLFLYARDRDRTPKFISGVLHPLWDLQFEIGHSSRTISEATQIARDDIASCTAMLDGRFLAGDQGLFDKFSQRLFKKLPKKTVATLKSLRDQRDANRRSVQLLEPNVKESPGGLRDIQLLEWALKSRAGDHNPSEAQREYLDQEDVAALNQGRDFLWRVRHELHFIMKRKHDVLENAAKPKVALNLKYTGRPGGGTHSATRDAGSNHRVGPSDRTGADRGLELSAEQFMRDYYLRAREIFQLVDLGFAHLVRSKIRGRQLLLEEGVVAIDEEISLPAGARYFEEQPLRLLSIFALAQSRRLRLGAQARRCIMQSVHLIDDEVRCSPDARDLFMRMLRRKRRVTATLRSMHDLGVLGAYLPEFGSLTCLVQYDIYHTYTADEHTLVALDNLDGVADMDERSSFRRAHEQLQRRDLLMLGMLLHDVGKSKREDHIRCGIEMGTALLARLNLPEADRQFVLFLIEQHQEMVLMSQRRDLNDQRMIADFAALFTSEEWLRALYLMSYADLTAVATDAWSDWHGALLWELYHKTEQQLQSGFQTLEDREHSRARLDTHLRSVKGLWPPSKVMAFEEHVQRLPPRYLVAHEREQIEQHMEFVDEVQRSGTQVHFTALSDRTQVLVCTHDHSRMLSQLCGVLAVNDINILRADVNTRADDMAIDLFQVTDVDGSPELPERKQRRVREQLIAVFDGAIEIEALLDSYSANWNRRKTGRPQREPLVEFENQVSDSYTVIDVEAFDRVGVLYEITHLLALMELDIHMAIVNTVVDRARDAFYIVDNKGQKIANYGLLESVRERLIDILTDA